MAKATAFMDTWLAKLTSRKLMVWLTATGLTLAGHVTSEDWVIISAIYIGGQTVIDGIANLEVLMTKKVILEFVLKLKCY